MGKDKWDKVIEYLKNSKPEYNKAITTSGKFDKDAEEILKVAINYVKETL